MKVFNLFFRMARNFKLQILIFMGICVLMSLPIKQQLNDMADVNYDTKNINLTIIDHDQDIASEALIEYLSSKANLVEVEDNLQARLDAIFFKKTDYILEIPNGWTQSILAQDDIRPFITQIGSQTKMAASVDAWLMTYVKSLEVSRLRLGENPDPSEIKSLLKEVQHDLNGQVKMDTLAKDVDMNTMIFGEYFQSFAIYAMTMIFITVFGNIILSMRSPEVSKREWLGKHTEIKRTLQTWMASLIFALLIWLGFGFIGLTILGWQLIQDPKFWMVLLNGLICVFGLQSMAYFVAVMIPNKGMVSFMGNVISLVLAFFSGLFVPLEFVDKTAQSLVSIASPIWYMRTNKLIMELKQIQWNDMTQILQNFGIQLLIAIAFLGMSYIIQRHRLVNRIYLD